MPIDSLSEVFTAEALRATAPLLIVSIGIMLALVVDIVPVLAPGRAAVVLATLVVAGASEVSLFAAPQAAPVLGGGFLADRATAAWGLLFLCSALVAWFFGRRYYREERAFLMEHDILMLCAVVGMMLMAGAQDLLSFFIGLELLSVPLYALAGFQRHLSRSVEAGLKYFMLGAFSAGLFLYGAALCYAATGDVRIEALAQADLGEPMLAVGVALIAASLFFKASIFPFHFWAPDVYQGSPTPVTVFMATGTKAAAFAFLLNMTPALPVSATATLSVLALATMAIGNLGALVQSDLKRMLAFSSVAHAGVMLLLIAGTVASGGELRADAVDAGLFYMAAYVFTAGGAFGLIALLEAGGERFTQLDSLRGLARRRPGVAAAMALFVLSLGGIPATGGFLGKYLVFSLAVRADLIAVAVIGILLSVVALGYYLRVVVAMYMQPEDEAAPAPTASFLPASIGAVVCAAMVLVLGLLPGLLLDRLG
jgi:NADH-quinone oxidoreductase subunit N